MRKAETNEDNTCRHDYQGDFAEKDEETGWNSFQLRQYDAVLGRWVVMDPYGQYFSPYLGMGNNPVIRIDPDGGKTDDPPRMLDEVTVRATRLPSFWQRMKSSLSRADAWFSGRGGMQLAQTIADMNPLMSVAHLASQAREGTNAYGKKMSGMDIASKAADLVPFGAAANAGRKGLLMLGKGVGRLAGGGVRSCLISQRPP